MAIEPRTRRERLTLNILLSPTLFWLIFFFAIPLVIILILSFLDNSPNGRIVWNIQLDNYIRFADQLYIKIFIRSFFIALITTIICLLIGYPMAYWMANQSLKKRNTFLLLIMLPFWTNFVIRTYAWKMLLARQGQINQLLIALKIIDEDNVHTFLNTNAAVIMGLIYIWVVAMVLACFASISGLDRSLLEAAQDLFANPARTFLRVTLPLTLPGIVSGSILVFVPSFGAFVTPDMLGGGKADMIGNLISQQFGESLDWPFGSAISAILMIVMLFGTLLYFRGLRSGEAQS
ncbi:MAG: ABC transporter permease [Chloroflexi bacterium]|nr:ABC transporter permease [Chloroflexota bacterium]